MSLVLTEAQRLAAIDAELARRAADEERETLSTSFRAFVPKAWKVLKPAEPFHHNWHIDAVCEHLEAVSAGEIQRLQVWIPRATMKPVDVDALVLTGTGERKRLGDIEVGDTVITHHGRPRGVSAVHEQGLLPTLLIRTELGREVAAAPDHPFLTTEGWKVASELKVKDVLGAVARPQTYGSNGHPPEELRLIGYFVGDGNCTFGTRNHALAANITCFDDVQGEDIQRCATALGFTAKYSQGAARRFNLSGGVREWLRETGLAGKTSHTKRVPAFIFDEPEDQIAEFIGAYFACDGTIGHWSDSRGAAAIIFNSVNRDLLLDVQHLLLRLGVKSRIGTHFARDNNYVGGVHKSWRLTVGSIDETSKFIARIPIIGQKAERLQNLGMQRLRFDESIQADPIVSIEDGGLRECRCLTVAEDGSFTANDLIVKNSMNVSIFWPAWEWTRTPWLRFWTASYELGLAGRLAGKSRDLMISDWYQARWGERFTLLKEGERYYSNDKGGTRLATAPGSTALGEHGHRIIIDDAINAAAADATSRVVLEATNEWYDATVQGSKADPRNSAEVIIMQRLHENDLAAHAYEKSPEDWTILCLPERYEANHPFAYRGDPRSEGELLWPTHRDERASEALAKGLGSHRAAGQMQQRPGAREGEILKRHWWRFYDPKLFRDEKLKERRPKFRSVVISVDTPLKDRESNDLIAVQAWGVIGADRYLIDLWKGHANFSQAKSQILRMSRDVRKMFPSTAHQILIENAGYGVELIQELKREVTGVVKISRGADGDKILRAESAASDLESGNCFLPGFRLGSDEFSMPDEARTPADVVDFIDSAALFPNAKHDDDVDAWSQCMNWLRSRTIRPARTSSPFRRRRG